MLLHPSGDINAPIACHLYNPTFYAKDPYSRETDNNTNPTIQQVNQAGFTSQNCFMFDHICRRDRTEDVLLFYGDEIRSIHEDFMLSLRKIMTAKVEICWGRHVREDEEARKPRFSKAVGKLPKRGTLPRDGRS